MFTGCPPTAKGSRKNNFIFLHLSFSPSLADTSEAELRFLGSSHWGVDPYGPEAGSCEKNQVNPVNPVRILFGFMSK
jgi:hypothetical protein